MNFDEMQSLVTTDDATYGPLPKDDAVALRERLRSEGKQAEAWAAQVPDKRRLTAVPA